jgi:hypothetical protein
MVDWYQLGCGLAVAGLGIGVGAGLAIEAYTAKRHAALRTQARAEEEKARCVALTRLMDTFGQEMTPEEFRRYAASMDLVSIVESGKAK